MQNQGTMEIDEFKDILTSRDAFKTWARAIQRRLEAVEASRPVRLESESTDKLRKAIAAVSIDAEVPVASNENQYKKKSYSLGDLQIAIKEACKKHKLGIAFDEREDNDGSPVLITTVTHLDSEEFRVIMTPATPLKNENPIFAKSGGYTFAKRRVLQSLFNLGGDSE